MISSWISTKVYIPGHYEKVRVMEAFVDGQWQVYENDKCTWDMKVQLAWDNENGRWCYITSSPYRCIMQDVPGYERFDKASL